MLMPMLLVRAYSDSLLLQSCKPSFSANALVISMAGQQRRFAIGSLGPNVSEATSDSTCPAAETSTASGVPTEWQATRPGR